MPGNSWWSFLDQQLRDRGWSPSDLARAAGVSQGRIADWRDSGTVPSVKNARVVAHALDLPVLVVLVAAGILTADEVDLPERPSLGDFTSLELLGELERRIHEEQQSRRRLVHELASSGVINPELAHTDRLFAEVEQAIQRRASTRPKPRPRLRAVTDDQDEQDDRDDGQR